SENLYDIVIGMIEEVVNDVVDTHTQDEDSEAWDLDSLIEYVHANLVESNYLTKSAIENKEPEAIKQLIMEKVLQKYQEKEADLGSEQMREFEKVILLRTVDTKWMDHIDSMDQLRQGIHLRAYGQNDPLGEYQMEGFAMFEAMVQSINEEVARYVMKAQVRANLERQEVAKNATAVTGDQSKKQKKKTPFVKGETVGRNDPCPCGSGKKYKQCHGR